MRETPAPRWFIDCEREHEPGIPRAQVEDDWRDFQAWRESKTARVGEQETTP